MVIQNMNAEKITKLPDAGESIIVTLAQNDNGARSLKIVNWKGARYYLTYFYRTKFNQKSVDAGWIACNGSDWEGLGSFGYDDIDNIIESIKEQVAK